MKACKYKKSFKKLSLSSNSIRKIIGKIVPKSFYIPCIFGLYMLKNYNSKKYLLHSKINTQKPTSTLEIFSQNIKNPLFYIVTSKNNLIQQEMKETMLKRIPELMKKHYPDVNYEIKEYDLDNLRNNKNLNSIFDQMGVTASNNDPILAIQIGLSIEKLNINELDKDKLSFRMKTKLDNLLTYNVVNDYEGLRESFRYIQDNIKNSIYLIPVNLNNTYDESFIQILTLLKAQYSKIIFIEDDNLKKKLKLSDGVIYEYYPPKLPYKIREFETKYSDIVKGVDIGTYLTVNPIRCQLNFGLFRDEYTYNDKWGKSILKEFTKNDSIGYSLSEKKKLMKLAFYSFRNVKKLANTEKDSIEENWKKPNKHYLLIFVPNLAFLNERVSEHILFGMIIYI